MTFRAPQAAALALALALARPAGAAAVVAPTTVEALARGADAVVRGRVLGQRVRWSADRRRLLTDVEVEVAQVWRGRAPARVTVVVPGGALDGVAQRVDGAPALVDGEEVALFLARAGPRHFVVHGLGQGSWAVAGGQARPALRGFAFLPGGGPPPGERRPEPMAAGELERRVRGTR